MARTDHLVATSAPSSPPWEGPCTPAPASLPPIYLTVFSSPWFSREPRFPQVRGTKVPSGSPTPRPEQHLQWGTWHAHLSQPGKVWPPSASTTAGPAAGWTPVRGFFLERPHCFYVKGCTLIISILNNIRKDQNAGPPDRAISDIIDPFLDISKSTVTHRAVAHAQGSGQQVTSYLITTRSYSVCC